MKESKETNKFSSADQFKIFKIDKNTFHIADNFLAKHKTTQKHVDYFDIMDRAFQFIAIVHQYRRNGEKTQFNVVLQEFEKSLSITKSTKSNTPSNIYAFTNKNIDKKKIYQTLKGEFTYAQKAMGGGGCGCLCLGGKKNIDGLLEFDLHHWGIAKVHQKNKIFSVLEDIVFDERFKVVEESFHLLKKKGIKGPSLEFFVQKTPILMCPAQIITSSLKDASTLSDVLIVSRKVRISDPDKKSELSKMLFKFSNYYKGSYASEIVKQIEHFLNKRNSSRAHAYKYLAEKAVQIIKLEILENKVTTPRAPIKIVHEPPPVIPVKKPPNPKPLIEKFCKLVVLRCEYAFGNLKNVKRKSDYFTIFFDRLFIPSDVELQKVPIFCISLKIKSMKNKKINSKNMDSKLIELNGEVYTLKKLFEKKNIFKFIPIKYSSNKSGIKYLLQRTEKSKLLNIELKIEDLTLFSSILDDSDYLKVYILAEGETKNKFNKVALSKIYLKPFFNHTFIYNTMMSIPLTLFTEFRNTQSDKTKLPSYQITVKKPLPTPPSHKLEDSNIIHNRLFNDSWIMIEKKDPEVIMNLLQAQESKEAYEEPQTKISKTPTILKLNLLNELIINETKNNFIKENAYNTLMEELIMFQRGRQPLNNKIPPTLYSRQCLYTKLMNLLQENDDELMERASISGSNIRLMDDDFIVEEKEFFDLFYFYCKQWWNFLPKEQKLTLDSMVEKLQILGMSNDNYFPLWKDLNKTHYFKFHFNNMAEIYKNKVSNVLTSSLLQKTKFNAYNELVQLSYDYLELDLQVLNLEFYEFEKSQEMIDPVVRNHLIQLLRAYLMLARLLSATKEGLFINSRLYINHAIIKIAYKLIQLYHRSAIHQFCQSDFLSLLKTTENLIETNFDDHPVTILKDEDVFWLLVSLAFGSFSGVLLANITSTIRSYKLSDSEHHLLIFDKSLDIKPQECIQSEYIGSCLFTNQHYFLTFGIALMKKYLENSYLRLLELGFPFESIFMEYYQSMGCNYLGNSLLYKVWNMLFFEVGYKCKENRDQILICSLLGLFKLCEKELDDCNNLYEVKQLMKFTGSFYPKTNKFIKYMLSLRKKLFFEEEVKPHGIMQDIINAASILLTNSHMKKENYFMKLSETFKEKQKNFKLMYSKLSLDSADSIQNQTKSLLDFIKKIKENVISKEIIFQKNKKPCSIPFPTFCTETFSLLLDSGNFNLPEDTTFTMKFSYGTTSKNMSVKLDELEWFAFQIPSTINSNSIEIKILSVTPGKQIYAKQDNDENVLINVSLLENAHINLLEHIPNIITSSELIFQSKDKKIKLMLKIYFIIHTSDPCESLAKNKEIVTKQNCRLENLTVKFI